MRDKSYVTLERRVCVVCGREYDTGDLLMDMRLRERFDMHTVTGWGLCPDDAKLKADGFIALVGCKDGRDNMKPEEAYRTGVVVHIKREAFERVFNVPVPDGGMAFCDPDVIEQLKLMMAEAESE